MNLNQEIKDKAKGDSTFLDNLIAAIPENKKQALVDQAKADRIAALDAGIAALQAEKDQLNG